MAERNKYGLSRNIPAATKREIRRRCGFGCVICGLGFYDYEHFAPDFCDAMSHDPNGMTLLCTQCNQKRRRGVLSVETVARYNNNPKSLEDGYSQEWLDISTESVEVIFAGSRFIDCDTIVNVAGDSVLSVLPPERSGAPYRISGLFTDNTGAVTLRIDENQWIAGADNWDVEWVGRTLTIRNGPGQIVLVMTTLPPDKLIVERLHMSINGVVLIGNEDELKIETSDGTTVAMGKCNATRCRVGIQILDR